MLQIAIVSNHQNGRDTHVRELKVFGPRLRDNVLAPKCLAARYMFPDPADVDADGKTVSFSSQRAAKKSKADKDTDVTMDGDTGAKAQTEPEIEYPIDRLLKLEPQMSFQTVELQQHQIIR